MTIDEMQAEAEKNRAVIAVANVGDAVTTPRGGMPGVVALVYPWDGTRLVTSDGRMPNLSPATWCECVRPDARYFEWVGGPSNGSHGWFDGTCGKVYQWG